MQSYKKYHLTLNPIFCTTFAAKFEFCLFQLLALILSSLIILLLTLILKLILVLI